MEFNYRSLDSNGDVKVGSIVADTASEASFLLSDQGLYVVELREGKKDLWARLHEPRGSQHRVDRRDVQAFIKDLGQLIGSGINLESSLRLTTEMAEKPAVKKVIAAIRNDLRTGSNFTDACARHETVFSKHMLAAFQAAERTGQLEVALTQLSQSEEQILKFREQLISNLIYPAILFTMVMATFALVIFVVLPEFTPLFAMAQDDVPFMTRAVVAFSEFVRAYSVLLLIAVILAGIGITTAFKNPDTRRKIHTLLIENETLRTWFLPPDLIRGSQILGSSLSVGVRIDSALRLTAESMTNMCLKDIFIEASEAVRRGDRLGGFLIKQEAIPRLFVHFVKIGEETGNLGKMCLEVSGHLTRGYEKRLDRLLAILPPVVTLILGGMIAILVGSILLGMISLNNAVF